jgi:hypothetical protein
VAKAAGADDAKCVKNLTKLGGDATTCTDDQATLKTSRAEDKLLQSFVTFCASPPAFAANVGSCCEGGANDGDVCSGALDCPGGSCAVGACVSGAAEDAANAIAHDLFGATLVVSSGNAGKCQHIVMNATSSVHSERWKPLVKCTQQNLATLASEAAFVSTCLGPPQPTSFGRIASREAALASRIQRSCVNRGVTPVGAVLPGACTAEPDLSMAACVSRRVACRFCLGAIVADDIATPLDCDVFDDGTANTSCP